MMIYLACYKYQGSGLEAAATRLIPTATYLVKFTQSDEIVRQLSDRFDKVVKTTHSLWNHPTRYEIVEDCDND